MWQISVSPRQVEYCEMMVSGPVMPFTLCGACASELGYDVLYERWKKDDVGSRR